MMLASRHGIAHPSPPAAEYICLSCRFRAGQQRRRILDVGFWRDATESEEQRVASARRQDLRQALRPNITHHGVADSHSPDTKPSPQSNARRPRKQLPPGAKEDEGRAGSRFHRARASIAKRESVVDLEVSCGPINNDDFLKALNRPRHAAFDPPPDSASLIKKHIAWKTPNPIQKRGLGTSRAWQERPRNPPADGRTGIEAQSESTGVAERRPGLRDLDRREMQTSWGMRRPSAFMRHDASQAVLRRQYHTFHPFPGTSVIESDSQFGQERREPRHGQNEALYRRSRDGVQRTHGYLTLRHQLSHSNIGDRPDRMMQYYRTLEYNNLPEMLVQKIDTTITTEQEWRRRHIELRRGSAPHTYGLEHNMDNSNVVIQYEGRMPGTFFTAFDPTSPAEVRITDPEDSSFSVTRTNGLSRFVPLKANLFTRTPLRDDWIEKNLWTAVDHHLSAYKGSSAKPGHSEVLAQRNLDCSTSDIERCVAETTMGHVSSALKEMVIRATYVEQQDDETPMCRDALAPPSVTTRTLRKLASRRFAWQRTSPRMMIRTDATPATMFARLYHASATKTQQTAAAAQQDAGDEPPPVLDRPRSAGIRAQLQQWQDLNGHKDVMPDLLLEDHVIAPDAPLNHLTRLQDESAMSRKALQDDEESDILNHFAHVGKEGFDGDTREDARFFRMGDLVEIQSEGTEREGLLAVYVRSLANDQKMAQFFTMRGSWLHMNLKNVQYSIPTWISPKVVEPLLAHLPEVEDMEDVNDVKARAYMEDLAVPREVAAPVVSKLLEFYNESNEIYRKHASSLDDAHNVLAHESDLRYGSLVSAATTLLKMPSDKLPLTALFTVRKALNNAGFAFNMDRRSHRLTGYVQIRSKEQVNTVNLVRDWLRQWQDNVAAAASLGEKQARLLRERAPTGAQYVYSFIEKARKIVQQNRETRKPLADGAGHGNIAPSITRLPITEKQDCVQIKTFSDFTPEESEIIRFLEAYACANMFAGLPRIQSLPPLLMHATQLYPQSALYGVELAFVFLQELGTILPYENRIRFDQHLLLPSSQHSRPLQNLMLSLLKMRDSHNFADSMADLRHDWADMPVYCIDSADAHEIDDGISIESAGRGDDGKEQYWVHIHIANPTAFFSRDHPLAKMARHMGETIYMPERTYMMLPRWSTQGHFSLAKHRPCLTFSAKMDTEGRTLDKKITPGTVHNVLRLTADEVNEVLGVKDMLEETYPETVLTVGGERPPRKSRESKVGEMTERHVQELKTLQELAEKRAGIRRAAGGIFFDQHKPQVNTWQSWKSSGLAWDRPYRRGRRTVHGDPVIEYRTRGLINWFKPHENVVDVLVREFMLLACELSATWCAERHIPVVFRGTVTKPDQADPTQYWAEKIESAMREDGGFPMHLGRQYLPLIGSTVLRTKPLWHGFLGLQHYSKATSPLRRYGDMILHWQIEAALRHEATTGTSLVAPSDSKPDRSFLPFSEPVLDTIMLGLQPREQIIMRAKMYAENFWSSMLMFRKHHYGDGEPLPFGPGPEHRQPLRVYLHNSPMQTKDIAGLLIELNMNAIMLDPEKLGLPEPRLGDVWECQMESVNVYLRQQIVKPLRLIGREGAGFL